METAVILFSHGSVLCGADKILLEHVQRLEGEFGTVKPGFLNYSSPSIEETVRSIREKGFRKIVIVPYFLVTGKFALGDLPDRIASLETDYSELELILTPGISNIPEIEESLLEMAFSSAAEEFDSCLPRFPGDCRKRETCPLFGNPPCRIQTSSHRTEIMADFSRAGKRETYDALLIIAHGSPREDANLDLMICMGRIRERNRFGNVAIAFLDCNTPTITQSLKVLAENGARTVAAVPAFLHAGKHVMRDIPRELRDGSSGLGLDIHLARPIGVSSRITRLVKQKALDHV